MSTLIFTFSMIAHTSSVGDDPHPKFKSLLQRIIPKRGLIFIQDICL